MGEWVHHNVAAAACRSVGNTYMYKVETVPSTPPAAYEGAGRLGSLTRLTLLYGSVERTCHKTQKAYVYDN